MLSQKMVSADFRIEAKMFLLQAASSSVRGCSDQNPLLCSWIFANKGSSGITLCRCMNATIHDRVHLGNETLLTKREIKTNKGSIILLTTYKASILSWYGGYAYFSSFPLPTPHEVLAALLVFHLPDLQMKKLICTRLMRDN